MAHKLKLPKGREFQFPRAGRGGAAKYAWDEWFDGSVWVIERSTFEVDDKGNEVGDERGDPVLIEKKDYDVPTNHMPPKLKTAARRRYKVVQVSRRDADGNVLKDALIVRARDMTDEERVEEDKLRAEEAAERKAKGNSTSTDGSGAEQGE